MPCRSRWYAFGGFSCRVTRRESKEDRPPVLNPHVVRTHLRLLLQTGELAPYRRDQVRRQLLSFLVPEDCGPDRESEEVRRWPADPLEIESQLFESFPGTEDEVDRLLERLPGVTVRGSRAV